jgi:hypothetical protein
MIRLLTTEDEENAAGTGDTAVEFLTVHAIRTAADHGKTILHTIHTMRSVSYD